MQMRQLTVAEKRMPSSGFSLSLLQNISVCDCKKNVLFEKKMLRYNYVNRSN